jgi:hypothetical protein
MRMFILKKGSDLQGMSAELLKSGAADTDTGRVTLERIKELNPHVDFQRLDAGTVLLVPDAPDIKAGAAASVGGEAFDGFVGDVRSGLGASSTRIKQGFERIADDRSAVSAALKTASLKRLVQSDPALKKQLEAADLQFKADIKRGEEAQAALQRAQEQAIEELTALKRMFD